MIRYFVAYLFLLLPLFNFASDDSLKNENFHAIDIYFHGGEIVKNYDPLPSANTTFITELYIASLTNGAKAWQSHYLFPQVGFSLFFSEFGNSSILGQSVSIMPNFIFKHGNVSKFYGELKLGFGLAFFNKHYNVTSNPENLYIGSVATLASHASYAIVKGITSKFYVKAGVSFFHFSNGHFQLPNIGMNIPCLNIGIKYLPREMPNRYYNNRISDFERRVLFNFRIGAGLHEMGYAAQSVGGIKYPVYTSTLYMSKRVSPVNNFHLGVFLNYYSSYHDYIVSQNVFSADENLKASVGSIFIGHEFLAGHFGFVTHFGINFYNPFRRKYAELIQQKSNVENFMKKWSGNKFGVNYYPFSPERCQRNKVYVGVYLKTNFDQADFVEMGIGFTF